MILEEIGVMMYERQYITFAESLDGGKMMEVQAKHQWITWVTQTREPNSQWPPCDNKGPDGELHIWVKTKSLMKFQSKMERSTQIQLR